MKHVYILQSLRFPSKRYIGVASNLQQRVEDHNEGKCPYTSQFLPWEIIYSESYKEDKSAFERERQIKRWSRAKKLALVSGDIEKLKKLSRRRVR